MTSLQTAQQDNSLTTMNQEAASVGGSQILVNDGKLFKPIPKHPGYFVSEHGDVLSRAPDRWGNVSSRYLRPGRTQKGYLAFWASCTKKSLKVHRAVAMAWLDGPELEDVNHIDGNKSNNAVSNLEWATHADNVRHAQASGIHPLPETPIVGRHKETGEEIFFRSTQQAHRSGFSSGHISACILGKRRQHKGYEWRRAEFA